MALHIRVSRLFYIEIQFVAYKNMFSLKLYGRYIYRGPKYHNLFKIIWNK